MLRRWDPFTEIARLHDDMWRGYRPSEREMESYGGSGFTPAVDIVEQADAILVKAELPGIKPDDVDISVENDVLTIRGERKFEHKDKKNGYLRVERSFGSFTRSFALPKNVDGDRIEADMSDGILTVRVPKRAAPQPKRINVKGETAGGTVQTKGNKPGQPS